MLSHWIWLAERRNLPDQRKLQLLSAYGDPEEIYYLEAYEKAEDLSMKGYASLMDKDLRPAEKILNACLQAHLKVLTFQDPAYPEKLRNIPDPPLILYYKGRLPDFDGLATVGVVGTRHGTAYGLQAAQRLGYQIGRSGGLVISGMALGIDAMAMNGALMGNAPVVGVLGCGADQIYPKKNKKLFEDTERYGCILSEYPPGTEAASWNFPRRNRIISGLSDGVLVVEAPKKSGALITARDALNQGRDIFVVPGNIGVDACEGSNGLLRQGASAVGCGWDILSEYENRYPGKLQPLSPEPEMQNKPSQQVAQQVRTPKKEKRTPEKKPEKPRDFQAQSRKLQAHQEKLAIDNSTSEPYIDINEILKRCNSQEKAIVMLLKDREVLVDTVIAETGFKPQEVLASLTMLEIKGILQRLPGRRICLKK